MKFKPVTSELREEISSAAAALQKALRHAKNSASGHLKMSAQMDALEEEHAALASKRTLTRAEAGSETAIIAQKTRLAQAIEHGEAQSDRYRETIRLTVGAIETPVRRLATLAQQQVNAEVTAVLAPYFDSSGRLAEVARQTDLGHNVSHRITRGLNGLDYFNFASAVASAETLLAVLEDILADRDIYSLNPEVAKAA